MAKLLLFLLRTTDNNELGFFYANFLCDCSDIMILKKREVELLNFIGIIQGKNTQFLSCNGLLKEFILPKIGKTIQCTFLVIFENMTLIKKWFFVPTSCIIVHAGSPNDQILTIHWQISWLPALWAWSYASILIQ